MSADELKKHLAITLDRIKEYVESCEKLRLEWSTQCQERDECISKAEAIMVVLSMMGEKVDG